MPLPTDHISRTSLAQEAYNHLEAAIMDGTLEPGERLRDPDLVEWLGISRTPIRHALERLAEQGLIELEQNRYTRVAPLDINDVLDAAHVVGDLWAGAALRGTEHWTSEQETVLANLTEKIRTAVKKNDAGALATTLGEIAVLFARTEGNAVRLSALEAVSPRVRRLARQIRKMGPVDFAEPFVADLREAATQHDGRRAAAVIEKFVTQWIDLFRTRSTEEFPAGA